MVTTLALLSFFKRLTITQFFFLNILTPILFNKLISVDITLGLIFFIFNFPFVKAAAIIYVPASILSKITWCVACFNCFTPKTFKQVDTFISLDKHLQAPLEKGQIVGRVILELEGKKVAESQLITTEEVIAKGFLGRVWSNIKLLVYKFLMEEEA